ncbi:MAG: HAD-IC family P-type ATPase [Verrucomicrobiota bacterium]
MNSGTPSKLFQVSGLWCGSCAKALQKAVSKNPDIEACSVDFATHTLKAQSSHKRAFEEIKSIAGKLGYALHPYKDLQSSLRRSESEFRSQLLRSIILAFCGLWTMALALTDYTEVAGPLSENEFRWMAFVSGLIAATGILFGAGKFYLIGLLGLIKGKPTIDSLVTIVSLGCFALSCFNLAHGSREIFFDSAIFTIAIISWIRVGAARLQLKQLKVIFHSIEGPVASARLEDGPQSYTEKPINTATIGSLFRVQTGEAIPLDGVVKRGAGHAQSALFNGEADPIPLTPGSKVIAGQTLTEGEITVESRSVYGERFIDKLTRETIDSFHVTASPTPIERLLAYASPLLILAAAGYFLGSISLGQSWQQAFVSAISLLIVACPCALFFAKSLPILQAQQKATKAGVLMLKPQKISSLLKIKAIALDKTGTLTDSAPEIRLLVNETDFAESELWSALSGAERHAHHPIAFAVQKRCATLGIAPDKVTDVSLHTDYVSFRWKSAHWTFGRPDADHSDAPLVLAQIDKEGHRALFALSPLANEDTKKLIQRLAQFGPLSLLSGDHPSRVSQFAKSHSISEAQGRLSAEEKAAHIRKKQIEVGPTLYMGDGYNDIPALKISDFSIAAPHAAPATRLAADAQIISSDPQAIPRLFEIAASARLIARQNSLLALLYNAIAIPSALLGIFNPLIAASAMAAVTLAIALSSSR